MCEAGLGYAEGSAAADDSHCVPCAPGTYSASVDNTACKPKSTTACGVGEGYSVGTTRADDASCNTCSAGHYSDVDDDSMCKPKSISTCPEGKGYTEGTPSSNSATCTRCRGGTYSSSNDQSACKQSAISTFDRQFNRELNASNFTAALNTLDRILQVTRNSGTTHHGRNEVALIVVNNLALVTARSNTTSEQRRHVATILRDTVSDEHSDDRNTNSIHEVLNKTANMITAVIQSAVGANKKLATDTSQALLEAASSVLRSFPPSSSGSGSDSGAGSADNSIPFDQRAVSGIAESLARSTIRTGPTASVVAQSIAFTTQTVDLHVDTIVLRTYSSETVNSNIGRSLRSTPIGADDPRDLAPASTVTIPTVLLGGEVGDNNSSSSSSINTSSSTNISSVAVFQYGQAVNPFSPHTAADVVGVYLFAPTTGNNVSNASSPNATTTTGIPKGKVGVGFSPRPINDTDNDECTAVHNEARSGGATLKSTLTDVCTQWDEATKTFVPKKGCQLAKAFFNKSSKSTLLKCECGVDQNDLSKGVLMCVSGYTFDRLGHAFKPGLAAKPSTAPLVCAVVPIILVLVIVAIRAIYRCRYRAAMRTRMIGTTAQTSEANSVINPLHTEEGTRARVRQNSKINPLHTTEGVRTTEKLSRLSHANRLSQNRRRSDIQSASLPGRLVRQLFAYESHGAGGVNEGAGNASRPWLRYWWQRQWWERMRGSHQLLAIFTGRRSRGMGVIERLLLFLCGLYSNMFGVTLMFYLKSCYDMKSIFAEDTFNLRELVEARVGMMIVASSVTLPINAFVSITFKNMAVYFARAKLKTRNRRSTRSANARVAAGYRQSCTGKLRYTPKQVKHLLIGLMGWICAVAQIALCAYVILILTAAKQNNENDAAAAVLPCRCRISHSGLQSDKWVMLIIMQVLFWLFVSRPLSIGFAMMLIQCFQNRNRARRRWSEARATKRATTRATKRAAKRAAKLAYSARRATAETEIVGVSTGCAMCKVCGKTSGCEHVTMQESKTDRGKRVR